MKLAWLLSNRYVTLTTGDSPIINSIIDSRVQSRVQA